MPGFLIGTTVLDLSTVGPASRATRILADFGAQVIKIGPIPGKGPTVLKPPFYAYSGQRYIKKMAIDLRQDAGRQVFMSLATKADVVVESFRPGVVDRLGIGHKAMSEVNPRIVYCSTSGYGQDGTRSKWAGHDINYLATGGFLGLSQAGADGAPPIPGATVADAAGGGMQAAMCIIAALLGRTNTGIGTYLDVSATDGVMWLMSLAIDEELAIGSNPKPGHDILTGRYACYGVYQAKDGKWLSVGAIEPKFYTNLCKALGCDKWIGCQHDDSVQDQIREDMQQAFSSKARDEWVALLADSDCCVAPVLSVCEVAQDQEFAQRGLIGRAKDQTKGEFSQIAPLLAGMQVPAGPIDLPDPNRSDYEEILVSAGLSEDSIRELFDSEVIA